jgi:hypothetical protein
MDAERARATLAASLVNSWDSGAAHVEDNLATYLRESAWHPGTPSHDLGAFVTKWDRNAVAYSDSDVQVSDTDLKRLARVWQSDWPTALGAMRSCGYVRCRPERVKSNGRAAFGRRPVR